MQSLSNQSKYIWQSVVTEQKEGLLSYIDCGSLYPIEVYGMCLILCGKTDEVVIMGGIK